MTITSPTPQLPIPLPTAQATQNEPAIPISSTYSMSPIDRACQMFLDATQSEFRDGLLSKKGQMLAYAAVEPNWKGAPSVQVSTFAVDGAQSSNIMVVKRVPAIAEGPNFLLYVPEENGASFHEFNTSQAMTAWVKAVANDPDKLQKFAAHFSSDAAPGQIERVKNTMTQFAAGDGNAVIGSFGHEEGDIFERLHKDATVPPVLVNGLTRTQLHRIDSDGNVSYRGTRSDGEQVIYKYDAHGNLHGGSKDGFYFVKDGLNNNDPLVLMTKQEYGGKVVSAALDNVGANDPQSLLSEFIKQLRNPGHGLGTALIELGVPEDVAHSLETILTNPIIGTLTELNRNNRIGCVFGIDEKTMNNHLEKIGNEVQSNLLQYGMVRGLIDYAADVLEPLNAPQVMPQVNTR
ncbi:dermonecrotic toxin domain-containing protein [Pseudomonas costantinii]|nr:DUF6543 domain-containing protein [Pseudomonas costantinii]NVZ22532.1 hypothetical protein [Pseudomonas costantinii]